MKNYTLAVVIASLTLAVPAAFAQSTNTPAEQKIEQRMDNQQQRIGNGVENGSLTAGEAARIEKREANLNREVNRMEKDGNLSPREQRIINRQQNALSHNIYNQKHDAQVQPRANNEVNARQRMQQERIGQGIKSGSLTAGEAAHLENNEARINREVRGMRAENGGTLTAGERARVNHQQNVMSRHIYAKKHNGRVQR